jgi:hypothetical protein
MTTIKMTKTLPTSPLYTGSGVTVITLLGAQNMVINSKKSLIKVTKPKTKARQNSEDNTQPDNQVIDLKRLEQVIRVTGWIEDDATETAWNKFWKLTAMQTRGGPLTLLEIGTAVPLKFPSATPATYPTTTAQAFLENVTGTVESDDTGDITASFSTKPVRIRLAIDFYLGYER